MARELRRILYVEDEPDIRTIAVTVLETLGNFTVIACSSGREALEQAPQAGADLVLLDVMMPGMDGPTTLKALREIPQTSATPIIFMTAKVQASEIQQFKNLGAFDVIPKPFDPMALSSEINEIWQRYVGVAGEGPAALSGYDKATEEGLQTLYRAYARDLPGIIAQIEALGAKVISSSDKEALESLHRELHSLSGSAGTFGYTTLGNHAKTLELSLKPHLSDSALPAALIESLPGVLEKIRQTAAAPDTPL